MKIQYLITIGFCVFMYSTLPATPSKLESHSPFLPPGYSSLKPALPPKVQKPNNPLAKELEFRGVVQLNGTYQFSLFKKSENRGYWISENGSKNGISVSKFDPESMNIKVTMNGRSEQLTLMTASESPLPVIAASPPVPNHATPAISRPTPPNIPTLNSSNKTSPTVKRRTIPRRRVIVPPKR